MPTLYPAAATPGTALRFKSTGVEVKLIGVMGELCQVRLPDGSWAHAPMRDLEYGFDTSNVGDAKGSEISPLATTSVRSTELPISGPTGQKVSGAEFAKRVLLEGFRRAHPAVGSLVDNYGVVREREAFGPGTVLIKASTGRPVTVQASAPERGLFVCKLENGALEVLTSSELLTGDRQPLTKADGGTLQKRAKLNRGTRVRVTKTGEVGVVQTDGHEVNSVVEFERGSGVAMEAIANSELTIL